MFRSVFLEQARHTTGTCVKNILAQPVLRWIVPAILADECQTEPAERQDAHQLTRSTPTLDRDGGTAEACRRERYKHTYS